MLNEIISHHWVLWITLAVVLAIVEIVVPSFSFIFVAFGGLIAAIASMYTGWPLQIATFILVSFVSMFLLRPKFVERLHNSKKIGSRADALLCQMGTVTEAVDPLKSGRVTVSGQDWSAHSEKNIAVGKKIAVIGSDGIVLTVKEK